MANANVQIVGPGELPLITDLYNEIFRPPRDVEFFRRRFQGRYNSLMLVASVGERPVGFATGFELKPTVFFCWLAGVHPEFRRHGIGSQLQEAQFAWARDHDYHYVRMECHNGHRPVLHMAITMGFNIVGVRWDPDRGDNLIIFEKSLTE
jgi:GNAT superfamily N-acetyltransferase